MIKESIHFIYYFQKISRCHPYPIAFHTLLNDIIKKTYLKWVCTHCVGVITRKIESIMKNWIISYIFLRFPPDVATACSVFVKFWMQRQNTNARSFKKHHLEHLKILSLRQHSQFLNNNARLLNVVECAWLTKVTNLISIIIVSQPYYIFDREFTLLHINLYHRTNDTIWFNFLIEELYSICNL